MSQMIDFTVPSTVPGRTLHAFRCVPDGQVRAIVQLSHGMVEFIDRYKPLAESLAARGILVTGHDHLGHGGSIRTKADYGYFAQPDGNRAVLDDLHAMTVLTKAALPGCALFPAGAQHGLVLRPAVPVRVGPVSWPVPSSWAPASSPRPWCSWQKPSAGCWPSSSAGSTAASWWRSLSFTGLQQGSGGPHPAGLAQPRRRRGRQVPRR